MVLSSDGSGSSKHVLALNPFHGGSHRAFLEGWIGCSRHRFQTLALPARHWKWRQRQAAVHFSRQLTDADVGPVEIIWTTDMLSLAEFRGLLPVRFAAVPTVVYFHENQLTYPGQGDGPRDLQPAFTNLSSALAADSVWFNSAYHRDDFLEAAADWLRRMPDAGWASPLQQIRDKSRIMSPGVACPPGVDRRTADVLRLAWVGRWEHDKNPDVFFDAVRLARRAGVPVRLSVLGQSYRRQPACFAEAQADLADVIDHWGYLESPADFWSCLQACDLVVSAAAHEFFGMAVLEAVAAGCVPLVPDGLAYPEVLGRDGPWFYDGSVDDLGRALQRRWDWKRDTDGWNDLCRRSRAIAGRHAWDRAAARLDAEVDNIIRQAPGGKS